MGRRIHLPLDEAQLFFHQCAAIAQQHFQIARAVLDGVERLPEIMNERTEFVEFGHSEGRHSFLEREARLV